MKKKLFLSLSILLLGGALAFALLNNSDHKNEANLQQSSLKTGKATTKKPSQIEHGQDLNRNQSSSGTDNTAKTTEQVNRREERQSQEQRRNNQTSPKHQNNANNSKHNDTNQSQRQQNQSSQSQSQQPTPQPQQPQPQNPSPAPNPQVPANPPLPNLPTPQPPAPAQPQPPAVDQTQQIIEQLKSSKNSNIAQFTNDDGQIRTVLWTKGITGPRLGVGGDFKRFEEVHGGDTYITYATGYRNEFLTAGWYDTDKTHGSNPVDHLLCFGAVAANQLHWWMNYHKDRVEQFIVKTNYRNNLPPSQRGTFKDPTTYQNSFKGQQNSRFFKMISLYFGNNSEGYYADPLIDMFINGHKPKPGGGSNDPDWPHNFQMDSRGGFFHEVFGKRNLTRRLVPSDFNDFTNEMKKAFQDGESVGIIHHTSAQNTHIITAWGLEYDLDGNLMAVYITDSDDQDDPKTGGMKRYGIRSVNNRAVMSTNATNLKAGSLVDRISTLGLGEDKWNNFLK